MIFLCKSYEPAGWANLRRGGEARAGSAAKTRYGTAGRKGKLRHPPQPKYLEQVVHMNHAVKALTHVLLCGLVAEVLCRSCGLPAVMCLAAGPVRE